jgi:hypothetical protein
MNPDVDRQLLRVIGPVDGYIQAILATVRVDDPGSEPIVGCLKLSALQRRFRRLSNALPRLWGLRRLPAEIDLIDEIVDGRLARSWSFRHC